MTTLTMPSQGSRSNPLPILLALFLLAAAIVAFAAIPNTHPVEKHGAAMCAAVAHCFGSGKIYAELIRDFDGRKASICEENGKFYIRIRESNGDLVTEFERHKVNHNPDLGLRQVLNYLMNQGYFVP